MTTAETKEKTVYNAFIPSIIDDYGLTPYEFRIYCRLARRDGRGEGCHESIASMAMACQMSKQKVRDSLGVLVLAGIAKKEKRPGFSDRFTLLPPTCWSDPQQLPLHRQQVMAYRDREDSKPPGSEPPGGQPPGGQLPDIPQVDSQVVDIELPIGGGGNYQTLKIELPGSYKGIPLKVLHLRYSPEGEGLSSPSHGEACTPRSTAATTAENVLVEENLWEDSEPTRSGIGEEQEFNSNLGKEFLDPGEGESSGAAAVLEVKVENGCNPDREEDADDRSLKRFIDRIAYNWKERPWLKSPWEFKAEMIQAVWKSNPKWYCLDGSSIPNLKKITSRLRSLEAKLKGLGQVALEAYQELDNYWRTAMALVDPEVENALHFSSTVSNYNYYAQAIGASL